ncbi:hypothetical protein L4D06_11115 [Enterovibrio makurazakiensis]|uniref:hypothetical protein n=1 Tax=Enterovibrio makurazakiensis TaxID=2910232 RepID=UPI003D1EE0F9
MRSSIINITFVVSFSFGLISCGGGGGSDVSDSSQNQSSITPTQTSLSFTPQRHTYINENSPLNVNLDNSVNTLYWAATTDSRNSRINQISFNPFEDEPYISFNIKPYEDLSDGVYNEKVAFEICYDQNCNNKVNGSDFVIDISYSVISPTFIDGNVKNITFDVNEDNPFGVEEKIEIPLSNFHKDEYVFIETELESSNNSSLSCRIDDNKENVVCSYYGSTSNLTADQKTKNTTLEINLCGFTDYQCQLPEDTITINVGYVFSSDLIATYSETHTFPQRYFNYGAIYSPHYDAIFGTNESGFSFYYGNIDSGQYIDFTRFLSRAMSNFGLGISSIAGFALDPTSEERILVIIERGVFVVKPDLENPESSTFQLIELKSDSLSRGSNITSFATSGSMLYVSTGSRYHSHNEIHSINLAESEDKTFFGLDSYHTIAAVQGKVIAKNTTNIDDEFTVYSYSLPDYSSSLHHMKNLNSVTLADDKESCEILNSIDNKLFSKCGEVFEFISQSNSLIEQTGIPLPEWADSNDYQRNVELISSAQNTEQSKIYFALTHDYGNDNRGKYIRVYNRSNNKYDKYSLNHELAPSRFKSIFVRKNGELWGVMDNENQTTGVGLITLEE